MFCVRCGNPIEDWQSFCPICGTRAITAAEVDGVREKKEEITPEEAATLESQWRNLLTLLEIDKPIPQKKEIVKPPKFHPLTELRKANPANRSSAAVSRAEETLKTRLEIREDSAKERVETVPVVAEEKSSPAEEEMPAESLPEERNTEPPREEPIAVQTEEAGQTENPPVREEPAPAPQEVSPALEHATREKETEKSVKTEDDWFWDPEDKEEDPRSEYEKEADQLFADGYGWARTDFRKFAEKHMRSLVAVCALLAVVFVLLLWGYRTDSGARTFASLGIGPARGYVLLGDECMQESNYTRAVEYYVEALYKEFTYESSCKLASAYSYTGDIEKEASALLMCIHYYPNQKVPYVELAKLYPEEEERSEDVQKALETGEKIFGNLN